MHAILFFFRNLFDFCRHSNEVIEVLELDYTRIREAHKLDPVVL